MICLSKKCNAFQEKKGREDMKRKLLSILLTAVMIGTLLTGCGGDSGNAGSASGDSGNAGSTSGDTGNTGSPDQADAETSESGTVNIDFDEEPYEVSIQFVGLFEENNNVENVEAALNEITLEKINCTVDITPIFIGDLSTTTSMAIAGDEKMDIVAVGLTQALGSMVPDGLLLELDDLIAERGADVAAVTANVAAAQKVNGVTYAVSGYPYAAFGSGFAYNKTLAEQYGIDMHDGMTMDELSEVGEILKENGVYLTTFGNSSTLNYKFAYPLDAFGDNAIYGGILDPVNSTTVENVYDSENLRNYFKSVKAWFEAGYLPGDQLTDTTTTQEYFSQQKIFGTYTSYTPNQIAVWLNPNFEAGIVQVSDAMISTSSAIEFMLGISSNCERPDKAMDLINLIYADEEVCNLLQYGIEGTDYVAVEGTENVITYDGSANEDHNSYYTAFSHFGDPLKQKAVAPLDDSYYDELIAFDSNAKKSLSFGYSFDASDYSAEAGAISAVLQEKLPMLNAGMVEDVDAAVDELVKALEDAGINDVIAANQQQLDAYLAQ